MKHLMLIAAVLIVGAIPVFANGNNHSGDAVSAAPAVHHSSSAPVAPTTAVAPRSGGVAPRLGGMPNYGRPMSTTYRPVVTYHNGNRTLNYPAVGVSNVDRPMHSTATKLNNGSTLQRTAGNSQRGGGNSQRTGAVNFTGKNKLDPQTSARLRHWNGNVSSTAQAHQNHANNFHHHHDHDWWKHHCVAIIFFDWGWWGWWDGWWYPAWGYDPYSYYEYNEPIYGYGGLSPEEVVGNVQSALQQLGYYNYAVDGTMGPLTRAAIGRYQADNRLPITYAIDPATLGSLGIIR